MTLTFHSRAQRNRLLPHARVVLEKNREVELCEFCQRVYHIDEIFFCLEKENETSHALGVLISGHKAHTAGPVGRASITVSLSVVVCHVHFLSVF